MANSLNKVTTKSILDATIATADIADDAVTADKLANAINTDIAAKAVLTGSTNNTITTVTGANAIQGEANLSFDGNNLEVGPAGDARLVLHSDTDTNSSAGIVLQRGANDTYGADGYTDYTILSEGGHLIFTSKVSGNSAEERVRILSDGKVSIGTTGSFDSNKVNILGTKAYSSGIPQQQLSVADTQAYNTTDNGGGIGFAAKYNNSGDYTTMGSIEGLKANNTDGNYDGDLSFKTRTHNGNNIERMRIRANGTVSKIYQPCSFYVGLSNTATSNKLDSTETLVFATAKRNEGSHYNGSNGRFTAPVAGTYFVGVNILIDTAATLASRSCDLQKNGSGYATLCYHRSGGESRYEGMAGTGIIELAANDYISIRGTSGIHTGVETGFIVYLLG